VECGARDSRYLDSSDGVKKGDGPYPAPIVVDTIKGGGGDGRLIETRSRTGTSKRATRLHPRRPGRRLPTASFLRYLTDQVGADIIRTHGDRPCAELANPQLCHPNPIP
jgi:hypothetical protein